jgi:hypothetical protein
VPPLIARLTTVLREAIRGFVDELGASVELARAELAAGDAWAHLDDIGRAEILRKHQLEAPRVPDVSTDEALLLTLDDTPLHVWPDRIAAVRARAQSAAVAAAKALEPTVRPISLPSRTLRNPDDVRAYLDELRETLLTEVDNGPVVIR